MDHINSSVILLVSLGIASGLLCDILGKEAFHLSLKTVCSLSLLIGLLNVFYPLFSAISDFDIPDIDVPSHGENGSTYDDAVINETVSNIEKYTKTMINTSLGIPTNDFEVTVTVDKTDPYNLKLSEVCISFNKLPNVPPEIITDLVSKEIMCQVTVLFPQIHERIY